mgnify:CR=1 FL=1
MAYFIEVILPLALDKTFTYKVTVAEYYFIKPGMRIAVPFGKSKIFTALAIEVHQRGAEIRSGRFGYRGPQSILE